LSLLLLLLLLLLQAALGSGSEMTIDVAPGVDWTAMIAIIMAVQQVRSRFASNALSRLPLNSLYWVTLKNTAVQPYG
jgi:hypothetical protein